MKSKNNSLILFIISSSLILGSSGEFHGWGSIILHHVGNPQSFWANSSNTLLNITKPVFMLFVASIVTVIMALIGTYKYRKNINFDFRKDINILYNYLNQKNNNQKLNNILTFNSRIQV